MLVSEGGTMGGSGQGLGLDLQRTARAVMGWVAGARMTVWTMDPDLDLSMLALVGGMAGAKMTAWTTEVGLEIQLALPGLVGGAATAAGAGALMMLAERVR